MFGSCSERARAGDKLWHAREAATSYLKACVRNAVIDEHRRARRQSPEAPDVMPSPAEPRLDGDERRLVERAAARNRRARRYHAEFDATWKQLSALAFEGAELRDLLQLAGELAPGSSEGEFIKARNRAYTNHKRVRKALLEAVQTMKACHELSSDDAVLAVKCLHVLVRCQRSPAPGVYQQGKERR